MRRRAPRPLATALAQVTETASPGDTLAGLQARWAELVGDVVAAEAEPVSEREGVVTVACASAVWAQELELMALELVPKLNAGLGREAVRGLRFVAGGRARP